MAYKYAGNVRDLNDPWPDEPKRQAASHIKPPSKPKEAAPRKIGVFQADKCGTNQGYERHKYRKVPACPPCKAARAALRREERRSAKAAA